MKYILLTSIFILTSCNTFSNIKHGLNHLTGSHLDVAISYLGYPSGEAEIAGKKVYTWQTARSGSYVVPNYGTNTGYVGTTPFTYNTTTYNTQTYNYHCEIKIITDKDDVIQSWQYNGNMSGCAQYSNALSGLAEAEKSMVNN